MPRYLMLTSANAIPGQENAFNSWYDEIHLAEMLALPDFVAAQRFQRDPASPDDPAPFLAVYEIDSDDIGATLAALGAAGPAMQSSPAIDPTSVQLKVYQALGARRVA